MLEFEDHCSFPVAILYADEVAVYETPSAFTVCGMADLKAGQLGRFARSTLIDANGNSWELDGAQTLHGVGPFWGWNLFFNRTVRVRPTIIRGPEAADVEFVRAEVIKRLHRRNGLSVEVRRFYTVIGGQAARKLIPCLENATSARQIIDILLSADFPERA